MYRSEYVKTLKHEDLKALRAKLLEEYRGYRGTKHARFALDRLMTVDAEYCDRERDSRIRGLTKEESPSR